MKIEVAIIPHSCFTKGRNWNIFFNFRRYKNSRTQPLPFVLDTDFAMQPKFEIKRLCATFREASRIEKYVKNGISYNQNQVI